MRFLALSFFFLLSLSGFCQDLIVNKTGDQILCKILSLDSVKIIYRLRNESPRHEISMLEVENYYLSKVTANELEWKSKPYWEFLSLGFSGGLAYPIGDFASMDASSVLSGMAFKGYLFNGEALFRITERFGLSFGYLNQKHGFNYLNVANFYNTRYQVNTFSADGGSWLISGVYFGLYGDVPLKTGSPFSVLMNLGFGAPRFTLPQQNLYNKPDYKLIIAESSTRSASFRGGLGLRYKASHFFALHLYASYLSGHPYFYDIYVSDNRGYKEYITYNQVIQTINIQAGINFLFYRK